MIKTLPPAAEHHCTLLYFSRQHINPERVTSASLVDSGEKWLSNRDKEHIIKQDGQKPIWRAVKYSISRDYYPHIRSLLGSSVIRPTAWQPTDQLAKLLDGKHLAQGASDQERQPTWLELTLPDSSIKRLKQAGFATEETDNRLFITIENTRLHQLTPDFYTLLLNVSFFRQDKEPLHPAWIIEAVYHLSRFNKCKWISSMDGDELTTDFSLGDLARSLISDESRAEQRVYSLTMVRFDQPVDSDTSKELAVRLSRHYTSDYHITDEPGGCGKVCDFENVTHLLALEGAATVVSHNDRQSSSFLAYYYTGSFLPNYQPLTLLAFHEYQTLLAFNEEVQKLYRPGDKEYKQAATLKRFLDKTLQFRLRFQHPAVSGISMHNRYHDLLRDGFRLDALLAKLESDSSDMSAFVQEYHQADSEYKMRWVSAVATGGVTFLTVFAIVEEVMEVFHWMHGKAGIVAVLSGTALGIIAGTLQWLHRHKAPHWRREAFEEIVKHKVLK